MRNASCTAAWPDTAAGSYRDRRSLRAKVPHRAGDFPPRLTQRRRWSRSSRRDPGKVGIYACGPTVYSRVHVGNARPYVVFSLLKRFLEHEGLEVVLVANITDINDKIYTAARRPPACPPASSRAR